MGPSLFLDALSEPLLTHLAEEGHDKEQESLRDQCGAALLTHLWQQGQQLYQSS